ncbi:hypothetical protein PVL29_002265 [Vitis rotundifolia]|uniref:Uncharacterized protein n=1 Tax=Vitis rotundifolia TaxID=103349 RepID=A0AA39AGQ6_VITRO|nr:hypothetical protein PVL29_002265 [Vitis rotundifolia]
MDPLAKSFNPNKHLKEQFVSNLTGSSILEIVALSTIVPSLIVLRHLIAFHRLFDPWATETSLKKSDNATVVSKNSWAYMATMTVDFLVIILPILLFLTVLAEWTQICAILLMLVLLFSIAAKRFISSHYSLGGGTNSLRTNISSYRVSMVIVTCLCILAVDFQIFPRRYAKTETYGTSLMDLGVGSFVLGNALVSHQARNIVHAGEYGVHWNFFFTLAAVSILTPIVNLPPQYCGILGSLILIGHQSCLMNGLNMYLLSDKRGLDFISQNKEGIFSIFGYWGIYLTGVQLGNYLFFGNHSTTMWRSNKWARIRVWILSLLFWLLTVFLDRHVERVSRRMCNLAYVTLVLAQNLQVLGILMLSDYIPTSETSVLEKAFDRNLLGSFLLANILTGLVNLYADTLFASSANALVILVIYSFTLSAVTGLMDLYGIRLKFW